MPDTAGPSLTPEQRQLAATALHSAIARDWDAADKAVNQIGRSDPDAIPVVLLAWIDTSLRETGFNPDDAGRGTTIPGWITEGTDDLTIDADRVDWSHRWAGRLVVARINDDEATARALMTSVPDDQSWRQGCAAVLDAASATIRAHRAGQPAGVVRLRLDTGEG